MIELVEMNAVKSEHEERNDQGSSRRFSMNTLFQQQIDEIRADCNAICSIVAQFEAKQTTLLNRLAHLGLLQLKPTLDATPDAHTRSTLTARTGEAYLARLISG
jgi:hypothetical protein